MYDGESYIVCMMGSGILYMYVWWEEAYMYGGKRHICMVGRGGMERYVYVVVQI